LTQDQSTRLAVPENVCERRGWEQYSVYPTKRKFSLGKIFPAHRGRDLSG
jgi:hypothetical protein